MTGAARALVLEAPRTLALRELAVPEIGDDDGLLRVEACGLCGTDHELYTGALFPGFALVPGHEAIGVVERIGSAAAARWRVAEGDRVAVEVFQACGTCDSCRAGAARRCVHHGIADMYGFVPLERPPGLWGGYADFQYLAPDSQLVRLPPSLDPVVGTLFNALASGFRWGVTLPETRAGDVVVVLGPGLRGISATLAAKEAGASFVMITGLGMRDASRLALAPEFGADLTVDVSTDDPVIALHDAVGRLADVVIDVTAKAPAALGQAVALARPGGTVVLAGTRGDDATPGFRPDAIVGKELRLLGALGVDAPSCGAAMETLTSGRYPFGRIPRRVVDFAGMDELLVDMAGEGAPPPLHGVLSPRPAATR